MAKRVKKGFRMELRDGNSLVVAVEFAGKLRMKESSASAYDEVALTAAMCEAAGILDALEDVPEPWELVRDAVLAECVFTPTGPGHHDISVGEKAWRAIAKRLGKLAEVES